MRKKSSELHQTMLIEGSPTYWMNDIIQQSLLPNHQQTFQLNEEEQQHDSVRLMEINSEDDNDSANDSRNKIKDVFVSIIYWYKNQVSPLLQPNCRFLPTCSTYAIESMNLYGPYRGLTLMLWRILRCNPSGGSGYDPPQWPPPEYSAGSTSKRKN
eukprot:CAMPEP_0119035134 /NCGR_PEP_ID=MMETSP1177-20130426/2096_1 /TAXON_ID=2985 /ORGANISM="Ochromonas sp, Strain CCMP1899" /LENGTH=155 /DNA_ID=CAMNT_0006993069 /DNA_START=445 /DNA_END=912 /DNA_ORIENTATION=+